MIALLGIARKALQAVLSVFTRYPLQVACVGLACLSAWLWTGKGGALAERDDARAQNVTERQAYTEAQRQAAIRAKAAREAQEARYRAQAEKADQTHATELQGALDRARRYADAHRLRAETASGASSGTGTSAESGGPESAIGSDQAPVLVAAEDVEICTLNTVRLESAQEWARGLNP